MWGHTNVLEAIYDIIKRMNKDFIFTDGNFIIFLLDKIRHGIINVMVQFVNKIWINL